MENFILCSVRCFLTESNLSHRYGALHTNYSIENWWSHFKRSFSIWVMDYLNVCSSNFLHIKRTWSVYVDNHQRKLDEVKNTYFEEHLRATASEEYYCTKMSVFEVFLVRVFPRFDWIRRDTEYLFLFNLHLGKCGLGKLRIRTLFTQWLCQVNKWATLLLTGRMRKTFSMKIEVIER